jgi:hypothetical protein
MLSRTTLVLLVTHALMMLPLADGVEAPTAPDMVNTSAPAISTVIGFRKRPIESGIDDIDVLSCGDPPRDIRDDEEVLCAAWWGRAVHRSDRSNGLGDAVHSPDGRLGQSRDPGRDGS